MRVLFPYNYRRILLIVSEGLIRAVLMAVVYLGLVCGLIYLSMVIEKLQI
jgi:hypothetical protein